MVAAMRPASRGPARPADVVANVPRDRTLPINDQALCIESVGSCRPLRLRPRVLRVPWRPHPHVHTGPNKSRLEVPHVLEFAKTWARACELCVCRLYV